LSSVELPLIKRRKQINLYPKIVGDVRARGNAARVRIKNIQKHVRHKNDDLRMTPWASAAGGGGACPRGFSYMVQI